MYSLGVANVCMYVGTGRANYAAVAGLGFREETFPLSCQFLIQREAL